MIYEYECQRCGQIVDVSRPVDDRDLALTCECGAPMSRLPAIPMLNTDTTFAHVDPVNKIEYRGRTHWIQELKKRGEIPYSKSERDREAAYLIKNANMKDRSEAIGVTKELKAVEKKNRRERIRRSFESSN